LENVSNDEPFHRLGDQRQIALKEIK
jgi:hypothetical protein